MLDGGSLPESCSAFRGLLEPAELDQQVLVFVDGERAAAATLGHRAPIAEFASNASRRREVHDRSEGADVHSFPSGTLDLASVEPNREVLLRESSGVTSRPGLRSDGDASTPEGGDVCAGEVATVDEELLDLALAPSILEEGSERLVLRSVGGIDQGTRDTVGSSEAKDVPLIPVEGSLPCSFVRAASPCRPGRASGPWPPLA